MNNRLYSILKRTCLHSRSVVTPNGVISVPCGTCKACLLNLSDSLAIKAKAQVSLSRYCFKADFTYSTDFVPRAKVIYQVDDDSVCGYGLQQVHRPQYFYNRIVKRKTMPDLVIPVKVRGYDRIEDNEIEFSYDSSLMADYVKQANLNATGKYPSLEGMVGVLDYRDAQLLIKRINFYAKKITSEKIHYLLVGEYGPVTFRPHFHIVLCFDSERLSQEIRKIIFKVWSFGRVTCSMSYGHAEEYITEYVNSLSRLPYFLQRGSFSSFRTFSTHFASSLWSNVSVPTTATAISKSDYFNGAGFVHNGRAFRVYPSRSCLSACFLEQSRNPHLSDSQLYGLVADVSTALSINPELTPCKLAKVICDYYTSEDFIVNRELFENYVRKDRMIHNIMIWANVDYFDRDATFDFSKWRKRTFNQLYRLIFGVHRWLQFHKIPFSECSWNRVVPLIRLSRRFYQMRQYQVLSDYFRVIQDTNLTQFEFLLRPTQESLKDFSSQSIVAPYLEKRSAYLNDIFNRKIKHREKNDKNKKYESLIAN